MPLEEYKQRKRQAVVILAVVGNSVRVKEELYMYLEEQMPILRDRLFMELRELNTGVQANIGWVNEDSPSQNRRRYSFIQPKEVFLDFANTRKASRAPAAHCANPPTTPALLRMHRSLANL